MSFQYTMTSTPRRITCKEYYDECTKQNDPVIYGELFGMWRVYDNWDVNHLNGVREARVDKLASFLVGVYVISNTDAQDILNLSIVFDEISSEIPIRTIDHEEFRESLESKGTSIAGKNCLPYPLPLDLLQFCDVRIKLRYVVKDNRYTQHQDYSLLLIYDYNDKSAPNIDLSTELIWGNNILISDGCARQISP